MTLTAETLVTREVHYCVSALVSTLVQGYGLDDRLGRASDLSDLAEQAVELCSPIDDYEEAAIQEGYKPSPVGWYNANQFVSSSSAYEKGAMFDSPQDICEKFDIEPYQREVFEHWIVSDWLADKLAEKGEKVDKDFAGMTVWARTTTGQGIASDSVIAAIVDDLNKGA